MAINIGRREFVAAVGGVVIGWPLAARAQQSDRMRRLGALMPIRANDAGGQADAAALVQGLGALGWHDGGNLRIDWRWAGGDSALYERYAAELVALGPDLLLAGGTPAVEALRRKTTAIPIVFTLITDPVGQGLVASLAHPGGTITGFSNYDPPMASKWLEMLTQLTPPVVRVAVLYNPATAPFADLMLRAIEQAAQSLAVSVRAAPVNDDFEIEATIAALTREERGGLLILSSSFTFVHRVCIAAPSSRSPPGTACPQSTPIATSSRSAA